MPQTDGHDNLITHLFLRPGLITSHGLFKLLKIKIHDLGF